jgi:hypothetical protein
VIARQACTRCDGKGTTTNRSSRFELNVANANAGLILAALGLENLDAESWGGCVNANRLLSRIAATTPALLIRASHQDGNTFACGVEPERAQRYLERLTMIATEAARLEEDVVWG